MALYRVQSNGKAPTGLQAGDEVVTGGGTYRILGVNSDGSYRSALSNRYQTLQNYRGSYGTKTQRAAQKSTQTDSAAAYTLSAAVNAAQSALASAQQAKPAAYSSRWDEELDEIYGQITGRRAFSYDMGTDPVYQQYRDQYQRLGRTAMQDTMGRAAALTGGYGSSYAQQAGQQAYSAYLQQLNEVVPELYTQAREQYDREGTALYEQYSLLRGREESDYARYRDEMEDYYTQLADARSAYESEADRDYQRYADTQRYAQQAAELSSENWWKQMEYEADREDAANAQYWKQLAYADAQAAAAEQAQQKKQAAQKTKAATASTTLSGRSSGAKKTRNSTWTSGRVEKS